MTVFGSYKMLKQELVEAISSHVEENKMFITYEVLADITLLFSQYCSPQQVSAFVEIQMDKIMNNIEFATDEVFCKE